MIRYADAAEVHKAAEKNPEVERLLGERRVRQRRKAVHEDLGNVGFIQLPEEHNQASTGAEIIVKEVHFAAGATPAAAPAAPAGEEGAAGAIPTTPGPVANKSRGVAASPATPAIGLSTAGGPMKLDAVRPEENA